MPRLEAPLERKTAKGDTALESIDLAFSSLKNIVAVTNAPFISEAADLVLAIVNALKNVRENKEMFYHLVDDALRLSTAAAKTCQRITDEGKELSQDLLKDLAGLLSMLTQIEKYSREKVKRNFAKRVLYRNHDKEVIRRYREELKQALDTFHLETAIDLRQQVTQLTRGQTVLLRHIEHREATMSPTSKGPTSELTETSTTTSSVSTALTEAQVQSPVHGHGQAPKAQRQPAQLSSGRRSVQETSRRQRVSADSLSAPQAEQAVSAPPSPNPYKPPRSPAAARHLSAPANGNDDDERRVVRTHNESRNPFDEAYGVHPQPVITINNNHNSSPYHPEQEYQYEPPVQYSPHSPHSPPLHPPGSASRYRPHPPNYGGGGGATYNFNSGNTSSNVYANLNNDFSNNVYHVQAGDIDFHRDVRQKHQHAVGPGWNR